MRRGALRRPDPRTDLRAVYYREDPLVAATRRLEALRGDTEPPLAAQEHFARVAYAYARRL